MSSVSFAKRRESCKERRTNQSESKSTTTSAVTKLIPKPPARVVSKNANFSDPGALYSSIAVIRSSWLVPPSIREYSETTQAHPRSKKKVSKTCLKKKGRTRRGEEGSKRESGDERWFLNIM